MKRVQRIGLTGQTVEWLREQLREGKWSGKLPGIPVMAARCGVSHNTMRAAVQRLEQEGLILSHGAGRPREVAAKAVHAGPRKLRVMVLPAMPLHEEDSHMRDAYQKMHALFESHGHTCLLTPTTLTDLKYNLSRVKKLVAGQQADAWVIVGASADILQWFADQPTPAFAFGGNSLKIPMAGTGLVLHDELRRIYRHMIALGHRRIVMITNSVARQSSSLAPILREELAACGVTMANYHLPDWEESPEGLQTLLANTFQVTPPTALIVDGLNWLSGVMSFLAAANLIIPRDVSLLNLLSDATINWYRPKIAHIQWDNLELTHKVSQWVDGVARGKIDRKFRPVALKFIEAESIGRAPAP